MARPSRPAAASEARDVSARHWSSMMSDMYLGDVTWRKARRSVSNGACVEVASNHYPVAVRDSALVRDGVIVRETVMSWLTTAGWYGEDSPPIPDEDEDESAVAASANG
jgi:hypothetical protein